MKTGELPPPAQLMQYIVGKWISKPIYVAAELRRGKSQATVYTSDLTPQYVKINADYS